LPRVGVIDAEASASAVGRSSLDSACFESAGRDAADSNSSTRDVAVNVNTPEDLEREREFAARTARAAKSTRNAKRQAGS
jgi:GTP:adenosylcobinamide-phosphate guanylyltransferase